MFASTRLHPPIRSYLAQTPDSAGRLSQIAFSTPDYPITGLRLAFVNWFCLSGTRRPAEFDVENELEIEGVALRWGAESRRLRFGGRDRVSLPPGGVALSDPIEGTIAAWSDVTVRTFDRVALGGSRPGGLVRQAFRGEACELVGGDLDLRRLAEGDVEHNVSDGGLYGPCLAVGEGWDGRAVVLSVGDSISFGQEDGGPTADARGNFGYVARGLDTRDGLSLPYAQLAVPASAPSEVSSQDVGHFRRRFELLSAVRRLGGRWPFTHILSEHGVNDSYASKDWRSLQGIMQDWWDFLDRSFDHAPIVQTTYTPRSLSPGPDAFTTLAAQSPAQNNAFPDGNRWRVADWIRTRPAPLAGVVDMQPFFGNRAQPDLWRLRDYRSVLVADAEMGARSLLLANAPEPGELFLIEPGTPRSDRGVGVLNVVGVAREGASYRVSLSGSTAQVHRAGAGVAAMATRDGSHPSPLVHRQAAAAIVTAKREGIFQT
ncbi:hypothetical protein [Aureimonas pseudogalii]|uniref:Uncharacterized protein n=1 Tax=Aureimonas pseudogalii TaxID=1744844 RepID=A0A7W6H3K8_9HYPH|nr:hypothetical protein [Aureimonas pseudogalii]MBB3998176.1 hypothetical protein [Aureimonas pseudogalii]